jgi:hypothetical protein
LIVRSALRYWHGMPNLRLVPLLTMLAFTSNLGGVARARDVKESGPAPCTLLAMSDAQRIVGSAVKNVPPPLGAQGAKVACSYEQSSADPKPPVKVILNVGHAREKAAADMMWNSMKDGAATGPAKPEATADIGDEAFLVHGIDPRARGALSTTLFVRKGMSYFVLQAGGFSREPLAAIREIGKKIADRL